MQLLENQIESLFAEEIALGGRAAKNFALLPEVQRKDMMIDDLPVYVLFNPQRVKSVMADVSPEVIEHRQCFLCPEGLEDKQQTLIYSCKGTDFAIRVNPYPIFSPHFTISLYEHKRQEIMPYFMHLLHFSRVLPNYYVFYNGPMCGASAPDHIHFQAISKRRDAASPCKRLETASPCGGLPLPEKVQSQMLLTDGITFLKPQAMGAVLIQGHSQWDMDLYFNRLMRNLTTVPGEYEPRINIVSWWNEKRKRYQTIVYLRKCSRPKCFDKKGEKQILMSPGAVEMCGVGIVSDAASFERITETDFRQILLDVSLPKLQLQKLNNIINKK